MTKPKQARSWHPEQIKAEIRMKGQTLTALALSADHDPSICRVALRRPSPVGERIISAFLNVSLHELWPDRYDPSGERLKGRHVRDVNTTDRAAAHGLNAAAR